MAQKFDNAKDIDGFMVYLLPPDYRASASVRIRKVLKASREPFLVM